MQADPLVSLQRVSIRGRPGEVIPLEYLQSCHRYHEEWLLVQNERPLLLLNANVDVKNDRATLEKWMQTIEAFIQ